jgi:hypothetical protein
VNCKYPSVFESKEEPMNYVLLEGGVVQEEPDPLKWAKWFEDAVRVCGHSYVGDYWISTVFLGIDHGIGTEGSDAILFETMVFTGVSEVKDCLRWATYDEAMAGHKEIVNLYKEKV